MAIPFVNEVPFSGFFVGIDICSNIILFNGCVQLECWKCDL